MLDNINLKELAEVASMKLNLNQAVVEVIASP